MTPTATQALERSVTPVPAPMADRNGSLNHDLFPKSSPRRRKTANWIALGLFLVLAAGVGFYIYKQRPSQLRTDLLYHTVRYEPLKLTVVERGQLESADNRDVICRVRAGTKATTLTIKWVIDDGTLV